MDNWKPLKRVSRGSFPQSFWDKLQELPADAQKVVLSEMKKGELWLNDVYQVNKRTMGPDGAGGNVIWLSIKRIDKEPCRDWRDFQRIKNQLCGDETEGIELYPAESRLTDTANQYHLWVFTKYKIPVGFHGRLVASPEEAAEWGSKQR